MQTMKKWFGGIQMTWAKVLVLAVATAVFTALINQVPFLNNTSFQDIAIVYDAWFLFAVFIIVNCRKWWEAVLKCFVFFLVSQPLIFLIEVPFSADGFGIFRYYKYWFIVTLLTIPGAAIAFLLKKKNWLSVAVLSVANGYLVVAGLLHLHSAMLRPPYHLLSGLFCFALALFFIAVLLDDKKHHLAALIVAGVVLVAAFVVIFIGIGGSRTDLFLPDGDWYYSMSGDDVVQVQVEGDHVTLISKPNAHGTANICLHNETTLEEQFYVVDVHGIDVSIKQEQKSA